MLPAEWVRSVNNNNEKICYIYIYIERFVFNIYIYIPYIFLIYICFLYNFMCRGCRHNADLGSCLAKASLSAHWWKMCSQSLRASTSHRAISMHTSVLHLSAWSRNSEATSLPLSPPRSNHVSNRSLPKPESTPRLAPGSTRDYSFLLCSSIK